MRIKIICATCASDEVVRDAWASWDVEEQRWVLEQYFDYAECTQCGGSTTLEEVPFTEETQP